MLLLYPLICSWPFSVDCAIAWSWSFASTALLTLPLHGALGMEVVTS